MSKGPV